MSSHANLQSSHAGSAQWKKFVKTGSSEAREERGLWRASRPLTPDRKTSVALCEHGCRLDIR